MVIITLILLFYPFINPFIFITGIGRYQLTDYYKFTSYNPIKPVFVTRPAPDQIWYKTYERVNLFKFQEINREIVVIRNLDTTNNEITDALNKVDLRNENLDETKFISTYKPNKLAEIETEKIKEEMRKIGDEVKKPAECRDLFSRQSGISGEIDLFFVLKKDMSIVNFSKIAQSENLKNVKSRQVGNSEYLKYEFNLKSNNAFKIIVVFDDNYNTNPQAKITKLVLVDRDCNQTEIPTKPDGAFDFEAVRSKWE